MTASAPAPNDWYQSSLRARRVMEIPALLNAAASDNPGATVPDHSERGSASARANMQVATLASGGIHGADRRDGDRINSWPEPNSREPRAPRPAYTEEMRFFIMYARIVEGRGWPDIENRFDRLFGGRSKGGLTSVYYRIRKLWGLQEVLRTEMTALPGDREVVMGRATNFTWDFLFRIGFSH